MFGKTTQNNKEKEKNITVGNNASRPILAHQKNNGPQLSTLIGQVKVVDLILDYK